MLLKDILNQLFYGVNYQLYFLDNDFNVFLKSTIYKKDFYNKFSDFVSQYLNNEINGIDLKDNTIIITILLKKEDFIKCM